MIHEDYNDSKITASRARELLGFKYMEEFREWLDKMDHIYGSTSRVDTKECKRKTKCITCNNKINTDLVSELYMLGWRWNEAGDILCPHCYEKYNPESTKVGQIKKAYRDGYKQSDIAKKFDVSRQYISQVLK